MIKLSPDGLRKADSKELSWEGKLYLSAKRCGLTVNGILWGRESKCSQWGRNLLGHRTLRWANCSCRAGGLANPAQRGFIIAVEQWLMDALIIPFQKEESSIMAIPLFLPHGVLAANTFSVSTCHWIIRSHIQLYQSVLLFTQRSWTLTYLRHNPRNKVRHLKKWKKNRYGC